MLILRDLQLYQFVLAAIYMKLWTTTMDKTEFLFLIEERDNWKRRALAAEAELVARDSTLEKDSETEPLAKAAVSVVASVDSIEFLVNTNKSAIIDRVACNLGRTLMREGLVSLSSPANFNQRNFYVAALKPPEEYSVAKMLSNPNSWINRI